jgi:3-hydroxybutyryl-CoA dehydrogenase
MAQIEVVGVIGAGQMGRGIAQVAAQSGVTVRVMDANPAALEHGLKLIASDLEKLVQKGKLSGELREQTLSRLSGTTHTAELVNCQFVVEAATENLELKQRIFDELDRTLPEGVILASNTSSISLTKLAGATKRPTRVIGMHFMNPVPLMKLV